MKNLLTLALETGMSRDRTPPGAIDRSHLYALTGFMFGVAAPIGWMLLRLAFFYQQEASLLEQTVGHFTSHPQQIALLAYMGGGTAVVLATFGFFVGRATEQIHLRAERLEEMNRAMASQKQAFEVRYTELNNRITNFHNISARIQKTMDLTELLDLTGHGLHDVMDFDRVNILHVDRDQQLLRLAVSLGCGDVPNATSLPLDERAGVIYKAVAEKRHYLVDDISLMPPEFKLKSPCDSISALRSKNFLACPVVVHGETEVVIGVDKKTSGRKLEENDADTLKLFASQLSGSIIRLRLFSAVETLTKELERTFAQFLQYRQEYQLLLKTLKRATGSTIRLVAENASSADVVREAVNATQTTSSEISASIDQVGSSINQLSEFMDKSISAMAQIAATLKEVDDNSIHSHQMSEQVQMQAEGGVVSVRETLNGLEGIANGVAEASKAINQLSHTGEEISTITAVITEIAQKTNLLALNAAIIAAQAGEQGRSFAVVAEEIRGLSQKTAHSSQAIAGLIRDIHSNTSEVVNQVRNAQDLVVQGVTLGRKTEQSLSQILGSATSAMDMARSIRHATREVSRSAEFVTHSIEELGEMTEQVSSASHEQAQGTHGIVRSIEEIREMADEMANVAIKQRQDSRDIETAVESVSSMAVQIFQEIEARSEQSSVVIKQLKEFKETESQ